MAKTSIIRSVWAQRFTANLNNSLVFGQPNVSNDWYTGDAASAKVVTINQAGRIQIGTYTGATITHQPITSSNYDLILDQYKYFSFEVDDVDKVQSNLNLVENYSAEAAYGMANTVDTYLAQTVYLQGATTSSALGVSGSATIATGSKALNTLIDAGAALSSAGVPLQGRYAILAPQYIAEIQKQTSTTGFDLALVRNGLIPGMNYAGFQIYMSQNLKTYGSGATTEYINYVGVPSAVTFALGLREMETFRHPDKFTDNIKGLTVYGGKLIQPGALISFATKFA